MINAEEVAVKHFRKHITRYWREIGGPGGANYARKYVTFRRYKSLYGLSISAIRAGKFGFCVEVTEGESRAKPEGNGDFGARLFFLFLRSVSY